MESARLVILAGGMGRRLRPKSGPKPLVTLAGLSLLERGVVVASEAGFDEIVVVTGYRAGEVAEHAFDVSRRRGIVVRVVHNDRYEDGNGLSVAAARPAVGVQPFALAMGDHVFHVGILGQLRQASVRHGEVIVAVDPQLGRAIGVDPSDAMKVCVVDGLVRTIDKELERYDAFDIGAFLCSATVFDAIETAVAAGNTSLAGAVQVLADRGAARAMPIGDPDWWFDIDTPRDHRNGSRHIFAGTGKPLDGAVAVRLNRTLSQRFVTPALLRLHDRITANEVTLLALVAAVTASVALAMGVPLAAAALIIMVSVLDGSDGEVARVTHRSSTYGSFLDPVLDRVSDGLFLTGATIYLANETRLADLLGGAQVPIVLWLGGSALVGHLLVSYTTAKAALDLGHRYRGAVLGGGHGRDLRLFLLTAGALVAAVQPIGLLVAVAAVAVLCSWIVVMRLHHSWWMAGPGSPYVGVRAVALDFDGTVADSMGFLTDLAVGLLVEKLGMGPEEAARRYRASSGSEFEVQLEQLSPGHPRLPEVAELFEAQKSRWMEDCAIFPDVVPAMDLLSDLGVPVVVCSSTRETLVRQFCERHGVAQRLASVEGWRRGHDKSRQLSSVISAAGLRPDDVLFVGDSRHDADMAHELGSAFLGLVRPEHPDLFTGSGAAIISSLSQLAAGIARASRSPVVPDRPGHHRATASAPTFEQSGPQHEVRQVAGVLDSEQVRYTGRDPQGGDRAVRELYVPVDHRAGGARSRIGATHDGVMGEDHGDGAVD